jgi:hypothetical protein
MAGDMMTVEQVRHALGVSYRVAWEHVRNGRFGSPTRKSGALLVSRRAFEQYVAQERAAEVIDDALHAALRLSARRMPDTFPPTPPELEPGDLPRCAAIYGLGCLSAQTTFVAQRLLREVEADAREADARGNSKRARWLHTTAELLAALQFHANAYGELEPLPPTLAEREPVPQ